MHGLNKVELKPFISCGLVSIAPIFVYIFPWRRLQLCWGSAKADYTVFFSDTGRACFNSWSRHARAHRVRTAFCTPRIAVSLFAAYIRCSNDSNRITDFVVIRSLTNNRFAGAVSSCVCVPYRTRKLSWSSGCLQSNILHPGSEGLHAYRQPPSAFIELYAGFINYTYSYI
jgi:hypothetical protein